jgi:hypothetical protein
MTFLGMPSDPPCVVLEKRVRRTTACLATRFGSVASPRLLFFSSVTFDPAKVAHYDPC